MYQWTAIEEVKKAVEKCTTGAHFIVRKILDCEGVEDVRRGAIRTSTQSLFDRGAEPSGGGEAIWY